jgi:hypothetical protein
LEIPLWRDGQIFHLQPILDRPYKKKKKKKKIGRLFEAFGEPIRSWQQHLTGSKFYENGLLEEVKVVTRFL